MKTVVKWYLSGLYKKPKGLKKPYNPILGETFRCYWLHPNGSKTFYVSEQVSHHPPVCRYGFKKIAIKSECRFQLSTLQIERMAFQYPLRY